MTPLLTATAVGLEGRLRPLDLALARGSMTAVIGPNGSGKTSLLRSLAGIDRPSGSVRIGEELLTRLPPGRRAALLGFLPAAREVIWPITVRDVVALGLVQPDPGRIDDLLGLLELGGLADRPADRLSTGERARALLARAMAPNPAVLLLDEPLSNLDPYWALTILRLLRDSANAGAAVLMSLHDLSLLSEFDRVLMMDAGRVSADGSPQAVLDHPVFSATFRVAPTHTGWRLA